MLTRISIARKCKRSYDVVRSSYVINIDCLELDSNIQRTDVEIKIKRKVFNIGVLNRCTITFEDRGSQKIRTYKHIFTI